MDAPSQAFDGMAGSYDRKFTNTVIGLCMRRAVWARCAARFRPGTRVLEMNCGTGEDALWLAARGVEVLATDVSPQMIQVAQRKIDLSGAGARVQCQRLAWEDLNELDASSFDGALSNFGGLNCVADLRGSAVALAGRLRPGAAALLCIMGPVVPWEWGWFLARGKPATAFRRLRRSGSQWSGMTIRYPSIAVSARAFAPEFRVTRVSGIGALVPPPYMESAMSRHARTLRALERVERRFETSWPVCHFADHYLLELERR
jgi:SAM-dependent methyltransferase